MELLFRTIVFCVVLFIGTIFVAAMFGTERPYNDRNFYREVDENVRKKEDDEEEVNKEK